MLPRCCYKRRLSQLARYRVAISLRAESVRVTIQSLLYEKNASVSPSSHYCTRRARPCHHPVRSLVRHHTHVRGCVIRTSDSCRVVCMDALRDGLMQTVSYVPAHCSLLAWLSCVAMTTNKYHEHCMVVGDRNSYL